MRSKENCMSWRKEQNEDEVERIDRWSLVCDTVPPSVVSVSSGCSVC